MNIAVSAKNKTKYKEGEKKETIFFNAVSNIF